MSEVTLASNFNPFETCMIEYAHIKPVGHCISPRNDVYGQFSLLN